MYLGKVTAQNPYYMYCIKSEIQDENTMLVLTRTITPQTRVNIAAKNFTIPRTSPDENTLQLIKDRDHKIISYSTIYLAPSNETRLGKILELYTKPQTLP